jgi:hypothetical protein
MAWVSKQQCDFLKQRAAPTTKPFLSSRVTKMSVSCLRRGGGLASMPEEAERAPGVDC